MSDMVGRSLGRYQVIEQLGEGGMASVYRAFDTRLERYVAIKVILTDFQSSNQFLKRFEREATALAQLSHPNIAKIHDYGEQEGMPYLVMEYIPGGTMKPLLGRPLDPARAARLLLPIAHALGYAHQQNIIHRDVKPANILLTESGEPMLSDFGIARILEADTTKGLTGTGIGIGTPEYMAPEQGMGEKVDQRADIYALGVMFYELVTGRKPYRADTPMAVMLKKTTEPLPAPRQFVPGLAADAENLIFKALAREPQNRFQDMDSFAAALEKLTRGEAHADWQTLLSSDGSSAAVPAPVSFPGKRQPWMITAVIALVVLFSGIALVFGLQALLRKDEPPPEPSPVALMAASPTAVPAAATQPPTQPPAPAPMAVPAPQLPFPAGFPVPRPAAAISAKNTAGVVELARWGRGAAQQVAYSPDGSLLAVSTVNGIYLYDAAALDLLRLVEEAGGAYHFAFSPDGQTLATSDAKLLRFWQVADGELYRSLDVETKLFALSPDGQLLASASKDDVVQLWGAGGGELLHDLEGHTNDVTCLAFSPDGSLLASGSWDNTVKVWNVGDGSLLYSLEGHTNYIQALAFTPDGRLLASGSSDLTVRLWQVESGQVDKVIEAGGNVRSLAVSPDGSLLAVGASHALQVWRVSDSYLVSAFEDMEGYASTLSFSPDGLHLAGSTMYGRLYLWDVPGLGLLEGFEEHAREVVVVAFSPDGSLVAVGRSTFGNLATGARNEGGAVELWQLSDGQVQRSVAVPAGDLASIVFTPDGALVAAGGGSGANFGAAVFWRESDGALLSSQGEHERSVYSVAVSPDGMTIASADGDGEIRLWQSDIGALLHSLVTETGRPVEQMAFSAAGTLLASGGDDGVVRLWNTGDGALLQQFPKHTSPVQSLAFSPDNAFLAVGRSSALRLYRLSDGERALLGTEPGKMELEGAVTVVFSPDGTLLVSGNDNGEIKFWAVKPASPEGYLSPLHVIDAGSSVNRLSFSPDGGLLAGGLRDGTVRLFGMLQD